MKLRKINNQTIAEKIVIQLQELISKGELKPGQQLPSERELAKSLGVGRASVREALKALSLSNIVTIKHGQGTYLVEDTSELFGGVLNSKLSFLVKKSDYLQLMESRRILEIQLAALAAERATDEHLQNMEDSLENMEKYIDHLDTFTEEDVNFHIYLAEAANNFILYEAISTVRDLLTNVQKSAASIEGLRKRALKYHQDIYWAIKTSDPDQAKHLMTDHLLDVECALTRYLDLNNDE